MSSIKLGIKAAIDSLFPPAMAGAGATAVGLNAAGTALINKDGNAIQLASNPVGTGQTVIPVSGSYTLSMADDGAVFVCTGVCTFNVPELVGLPTCDFFAPVQGSVTLLPAGAVTIAESTMPRVVTRLTAPGGFSLYADRSVGAGAQAYVLAAGSSWSTLSGNWRDAADLAAAVDLKMDKSMAAELKGMNGIQKMDVGYVCNNAQKGRLYYAGALDKPLSIPKGLDVDYACRIAKFNSNTAAIVLTPAAGVTLYVNGADQSVRRLSIQGSAGWLRCTGDVDTFYVEGVVLTA